MHGVSTTTRRVLAGLLLCLGATMNSGCAFLSGSVEPDEAWAIRTSLDRVEAGMEQHRDLTLDGAEALAEFALRRSAERWDLAAHIAIMQAGEDGTLTDEETNAALSRAKEEREKDAASVRGMVDAIRGLKVWGDTIRAFGVLRTWTLTRVSAGEAKRQIVEKALEFTGGD